MPAKVQSYTEFRINQVRSKKFLTPDDVRELKELETPLVNHRTLASYVPPPKWWDTTEMDKEIDESPRLADKLSKLRGLVDEFDVAFYHHAEPCPKPQFKFTLDDHAIGFVHEFDLDSYIAETA